MVKTVAERRQSSGTEFISRTAIRLSGESAPPDVSTSNQGSTPWKLYTRWQRIAFVVILFLATTSNYFDYFIVSVLLEPIKKEFGVSDAMLGILSGFCFAALYALTAIPIARWSDFGNRRTVITLALAAWSVLTALCGLAQSFAQLALVRFGVGAVEPGALPPAQSLIADYFPPERRATAIAFVAQGGSAMGWLVGIGLGGYFAATHGWRTTFLFAGIPGVVLAVVTRLVLHEPRMSLGFPGVTSETEGVYKSLIRLRDKRSYLLVLTGLSTYAVFTYGMSTFLPSFMIRSLHASMEQISLPWGVAISIANVMGALIGGILADRLGRHDIRWYAWLPAVACALDIPAYGIALMSEHVRTFIPLDFFAEIIISAGMPSVFVAMHAVCGERRRTMAVATALLLFSLIGSGLGPPLVGLISDALVQPYGVDSLRYSLWVILLFLAPASVFFHRAGFAMPRELEE